MKKIVLALLLLCFNGNLWAQAVYTNFASDMMDLERPIKVLKPRNYDQNQDKVYPLIMVLDGDYLFEPVAGTVDYLSYWDQMPESFVIGINQRQYRKDDTAVDLDTGLPQEQSAMFMDFVVEVVATMQQEYRVAPFTVIIGKGSTANLSSFYLMRTKVPFAAFIDISPNYTTVIGHHLTDNLKALKDDTFYYVADTQSTTDNDILFSNIVLDNFKSIPNVHVKYDKIPNTNSYDIAAQAIPRGLSYIFDNYKLIQPKDLVNTTSDNPAQQPIESTNALTKLQQKYDYIKNVYKIKDVKIKLVDIVTVAEYLIQNKKYDQLLDVSDVAIKEYGDLLYGRFIEGIAYEGIGRPSRALKSYNAAYALEPAVGLNKEDVLDKIEMLQEHK